jgi:hypothetical protein
VTSYLVKNLPSTKATMTDASGVGSIANHAAGRTTVTVSLEGKRIGSADAIVRPGFLTLVNLPHLERSGCVRFTHPMKFIVMGAGAVGGVVGTLLEHSGHSVRYWARAGQAQSTTPFDIQLDGSTRLESQPVQWIGANTSPMPDSDWVLVCVRTEQLGAALNQVVRELGADRAVAIATVTIDGSLSAARAAGLHGPVLAFHVSFGSGFAQDSARQITWFPFTPPSTVSAEGQPDMLRAARELARALAEAGLPCR